MRALMLCVNSLGFKFGRVTALKSFVLSSRDLSRYPLAILPFSFKTLLSSLFPVLLISNWPTMFLLEDDFYEMLKLFGLSCLVCLAWIMTAVFIWRRGLRNYEGQSL